jgi:hypothetical protein
MNNKKLMLILGIVNLLLFLNFKHIHPCFSLIIFVGSAFLMLAILMYEYECFLKEYQNDKEKNCI